MRRKRRGSPQIQKARAALYRQLVREAAETVFAEHGYANARIEDIAKASGVSIGTIYRVFPQRKQEIYRSIQEYRGTELLAVPRAAAIAAWERRGDLIDAMLAGLAALVELFLAHPAYLRLVLREEKAWAVGPGRTYVEQTAMWYEGLEGTVAGMRQGIADGVIVDDDPETMARSLLAMQQAHLGYWLEDGMRASAAEVVARLQRQFMRAFCTPEAIAARGLPADPPAPTAPESSATSADPRTAPRRSGS